MKHLHFVLLIFSSFNLFSDGGPYFDEHKFLKCIFYNEPGLVTSYHHLYRTASYTSSDSHYSFATLKTGGSIQYKDTEKTIPYVFYEYGKTKDMKEEFSSGYGYILYEGDSDEILRLDLGYSEYVRMKDIEINRYNLKTVNYTGDCELINKEIFIEARSNFKQLREKTLKEMQQDFAL